MVGVMSNRSEQFYGAQDIGKMFPEARPLTVAPFEQMGRRTDRQDYDREMVADHLRKPPGPDDFHELDPRTLHASQPSVTRGGVSHYMDNDYRDGTRPTYADQDMAGNRHPIVYRRSGLEGRPAQDIILSGHHRAAASLLQGRQFRARLIEGGWGPNRADEGPVDLTRRRPKLKDL